MAGACSIFCCVIYNLTSKGGKGGGRRGYNSMHLAFHFASKSPKKAANFCLYVATLKPISLFIVPTMSLMYFSFNS